MDKTIRRFDSHEAIKAEAYRLWQERSGIERLNAAGALSTAAYRAKGVASDVRQGFQRTVVRLRRL